VKPPEYKYQTYIRHKIKTRRGGGAIPVIADKGSGKTRPIVEALDEEGVFECNSKVLIICSGPAVATWRRELQKWAPNLLDRTTIHLVRGAAHKRAAIWRDVKDHGGIAVTNASVFRRDIGQVRTIQWEALIADEYHKYMRTGQLKNQSAAYKHFKQLARNTPFVIPISGSVVNSSPAGMFTAFQLANQKLFRSYWKFVNTFCMTQMGYYGTEIVGVRNVQALRDLMDRYMAYVPDEAVASQMPKGNRYAIDVEMTPSQAKVYQELVDDMLAEIGDDLVVAANPLTLLVRLRQLLCCPKIIHPDLGMGGGYEWILDQFESPNEDHPYCVIFVPFRKACEFVVDDLRSRGYHARYLRGGTSPDEQDALVDEFRARSGTGMVLVCTISYGESFDLEKCAQSYFLGYDYDLEQNRQSEGRTRRNISEHKTVHWGYIRYVGTIDDVLLQDMDNKFRMVAQILKRPEAFIKALQGIQV